MRDQRFGERTYSQHGEDLMFLNIFGLLGIDKPSYLDIGAHHPEIISNTKLLYDRGSRGINVECNPILHQEFFAQRPEDFNLCLGVSDKCGEEKFFMYDDLSGLNTFSEKERDQVLQDHPQVKVQSVKEIEMTTIDKIIAASKEPDLLTIDIEGHDYRALKAMTYKPKVVCTEVRHDGEAEMKAMMKEKGYFCLCRMIANLIFVQNEFETKLR